MFDAWMDLARQGPGGLLFALLIVGVVVAAALGVGAVLLHLAAAFRDGVRRGLSRDLPAEESLPPSR
jgi:hypothetical protein